MTVENKSCLLILPILSSFVYWPNSRGEGMSKQKGKIFDFVMPEVTEATSL